MSDNITKATLRDKIAIEVEECHGFKGEYPCPASKMKADRILAMVRAEWRCECGR